MWVVREGLCGAAAAELFDGLCQRLVIAGVPLWRGFVGMPTLHPQWGGYSYTWRRDLNAIEPAQFGRGEEYDQILQNSPFGYLIRQIESSAPEEDPWRYLRRRLTGPEAQLDYPILNELAAAGAADYFAQVIRFGTGGDPSRGTGIGYSFATDLPEGFDDDALTLLRAVLPAVSLAMMAHVGHTIASGLLGAYLGGDAGERVHGGAVERGSVESVRAVLWFADVRGFTAIADTTPGLVVIELLNAIFETFTASLRPRGGQVLKFLGDGMLAIFPVVEATRDEVCSQALDAAAEAMDGLDRLNAVRRGVRQADCGSRPRAPSRRSALWQRGRRRPPGLYRDRPGGQRSRPHRDLVRAPASQGAHLRRARRRSRRPAPSRAPWLPQVARRAEAKTDLRARSWL